MSKGPNTKPIFVLMMMGALGVGALAWYVKTDPKAAQVPKEIHISQGADQDDAPAVKHHHRHHVNASQDTNLDANDDASPEVRAKSDGPSITFKGHALTVPTGIDPKVYLAATVVKDVKLDNVRVLGVDVRNGVAVVNFSDDIDSGMGSTQEANFLKDLRAGFGQFAEVDRVEIDKDGQPLEELGHIELTDPLKVIRSSSSDDATPASP